MRLVHVAPAVAIVLVAATIIPGGASAFGQGVIVSPSGGGELEREDIVTISYGRSFLDNASTVVGRLLLDGIVIGTFEEPLPQGGENLTFDVPVAVPSNMTSRARTLTAEFHEEPGPIVGNVSVSAQVSYVGGPVSTPPQLTDLHATHVVGMGFRVSGSVVDDEFVQSLRIESEYGDVMRSQPNATWSIDLPVVPTRLGAHALVIHAFDGVLNASEHVVLTVVGEAIVIEDRSVSLEPAGIFVAPVEVALPDRVLNGRASMTCASPCAPASQTTVLYGYVDADVSGHCGRLGPRIASECVFRTLTGPGHATFAWAQASGEHRLLVTGVRV